MTFPNIYKLLGDKVFQASLDFAIIENGKIVATNRKVVVFSDLSAFTDSFEKAEGKILDRDTLKWMANKKWLFIEFDEEFVYCRTRTGADPEKRPYSGYWKFNDKGNRELFPVDLRIKQNNTLLFLNWSAPIPDDEQFKEREALKSVAFTGENLKTLVECFSVTDHDALKFEFWKTGKCVKVTQKAGPWSLFKGDQRAIIMSLTNEYK
jgi:hypothetical protein